MSKLLCITGPMFSGKSTLLIQRVKRFLIAGMGVVVFKPNIDNRYGYDNIRSHDSLDLESYAGIKPIVVPLDLRDVDRIVGNNVDVIAFEEAQFFESNILSLITSSLHKGKKRIVCAGLDMDYRGQPFGMMPEILSMADEVIKLKGICNICKSDNATRTYRKRNIIKNNEDDDGNTILVGSDDVYEARCLECWLS